MVEKFNTILQEIEKTKGKVNLLALLKMDELTDKWTVILSASWIIEGDAEIFKYVVESIKKGISAEEMATIARIGLFKKSERLVELLLRYNVGAHIVNEQINGNLIHDGYIVASNPVA